MAASTWARSKLSCAVSVESTVAPTRIEALCAAAGIVTNTPPINNAMVRASFGAANFSLSSNVGAVDAPL